MMTQHERANLLKSLHIKGDPLILFNIWDVGSAKALGEAGAKVIATSSWSVAAAHGCDDGERLTFDLALANLKRILASVDLPVTIDFEGGYGQSPSAVQENAAKVIDAGAVGLNIEDQIIDGQGVYAIKDQCQRLMAVRKAADLASIPVFINARTDLFLKAHPSEHDENLLEEAVRRAFAFAESGASGFFAPGLRSAKHIEKLCKLSPVPVNIMVMSDTPSSRHLAELGVARISYGPGPYCQLIELLKEAGSKALRMCV